MRKKENFRKSQHLVYIIEVLSGLFIIIHLVFSLMETELTSLCQSVLEDFNLVLFYLPPPTHGGTHHSPSEEEEEQQQHADSSCPVLPDTLVFKMVVTCLMVVHSLKRGGWCWCDVLVTFIFVRI